jgi:ribosomal protein S18 acetylase RimI-like enzyme
MQCSAHSSELLHASLLDAFESLCAAVGDGRFERHGDIAVMAYPKAPVPAFNGLLVRGDGAVHELESLLVPHGGVTAVDAPATLEEARRHGLIETVDLPGMLVHREQLVPATEVGELDTDALDDALTVMTESFGAPREWFDELYTRPVLAAAGGTAYVLRVEGRPVSTALAVRTGDAVGIYNVGTPAADRGQGYGGAVTSRAVESAFADGATFAYLQSSELGFSVYERLGFRHVSTYTLAFAPPR